MTAIDAEAQAGGLRGAAVAGLEITLGKLADSVAAIERGQRKIQHEWADLHPVTIARGVLTGAGVVDFPDLYGPKDGYWWDVRRIVVWGTLGSSSVDVHINDVNTEFITRAASTPAFATWSGQVLLGPRDRLVWQGNSGLTGPVYFAGQAFEISDRVLPDYLM